MASSTTYWKAYDTFHNRNNYRQAFSDTIRNMHDQVDLSSVNSCLSLGSGDGEHEINFVKEFAPNLRKFVGVERDHESAERMKVNLAKNLPNVDAQTIETDFRSWKGPGDRQDLVLLFNCLFFLNRNQRQELFGELREQWLARGGFVAVVHTMQTNRPGLAHEIWKVLGTPLLAYEDIEAEMIDAGFSKRLAHEMPVVQDHSDADESLLHFYQALFDRPVTLDELRDSVVAVSPDGKGVDLYCFAIFRANF